MGAVKIKCPRCKENAELSPDFALVSCSGCGIEMSYGEYVKYVAHNDATYSDILGDYAGSAARQTDSTLDDLGLELIFCCISGVPYTLSLGRS